VLPLAADDDPVAEAFGWRDLAAEVDRQVEALEAGCGGRVWVAANRYQDASEIRFHRGGRPETFSLNLASRPNQYDYWPTFTELASPGDCLVAVFESGDFRRELAAHLGVAFATLDEGPAVELRRSGERWSERKIYLLSGWTGDAEPFLAFP